MIFATEILPRWTETLGWTLLNSVWQGAITAVLVIFFLRILPLRFSKTRYTIACVGLALLFLANVATFVILQNEPTTESARISYFFTHAGEQPAQAIEHSGSWFSNSLVSAQTIIDNNMSLILLAWSLGSIAFSLRLAGGWWFISKLKSESIGLEGHWNDELQSLAGKLGINKVIQLAESNRITTPMVLGFFKPLVLIPSGMLSGLSTAEIETIFLHELAHIRRHDYIINIAQAFIETIFFFNPFVWIISNIVRREREYCCDDEVVSIHGSSLAYANALAQLEEWKLTKSTFALALAANKNQLLNRIKRIMEKTGQKYSVKDRFIPAALLIVGLVCASWLTVQKKQDSSAQENNTFGQDTTGKKSKASRTTIITFDENGDAHEQIFEEFDGDGPIAWFPSTPIPPDIEIPEIPEMPEFPAMPGFPAMTPMPAFPAMPAFPGASPTPPPGAWRISPNHYDTIPGAWFKHGTNWEDFSKEFEKKFSEEFSDFYKNHEKDFEKMMKEMEIKFKAEFENGDFHGQLMEAQRFHELAQLDALASEDHMRLSEQQMAVAEELASLSELQVPAMAALSSDMAQLESNMKVLEGQVEIFEKELSEMLVKDGYLKKGEKITNINWSDDKIEVNGKTIKASDAKRYHERHDKLFNGRFHVNRIE